MRAADVLFRVDAGPDVGLGHLQRCLSLAMALGELDQRCVFLIHGAAEACTWADTFGLEAHPLREAAGGSEDLQHVLALAEAAGCDAVVTDSYQVGPAFLHGLREAGRKKT